MFHKGLNKEIIIEATIEMIEEDSFQQFTMRKLAENLGVKTASLYTHIDSMDKLFTEVGLSALKMQKEYLMNGTKGLRGDNAVIALAEAFRNFAFEHPQLYKLIMDIPAGNDLVLKEAAAMTAEPFMSILEGYKVSLERKMHWQRILRGLMHGFVSEEQAGYFSHYPVSIDESYSIAIRCVIDGIHNEITDRLS